MNSESKFCEKRFCSNFDSNNILRSDFAHVASTLLPHCTRPCAKLWPYFYVKIKCKGLLTSLLWNDSLTALDMLHSGWYRGTAGRIASNGRTFGINPTNGYSNSPGMRHSLPKKVTVFQEHFTCYLYKYLVVFQLIITTSIQIHDLWRVWSWQFKW